MMTVSAGVYGIDVSKTWLLSAHAFKYTRPKVNANEHIMGVKTNKSIKSPKILFLS